MNQPENSLELEVNMLRTTITEQRNEIIDLKILLEIANERWVRQVNENSQLELTLRKAVNNGN